MEHFGADIGKLAVTPNNERDVLRLMELTRRANAFSPCLLLRCPWEILVKFLVWLAERRVPL